MSSGKNWSVRPPSNEPHPTVDERLARLAHALDIHRRRVVQASSSQLRFAMTGLFVLGAALTVLVVPTASLSGPPQNTFVALNECFRFRRGYKIDLTEAHMTGTDSIQFKDDCLKACLKTMLQDKFVCRSLMHMPRDDECVLTSMNEELGGKVQKVEDFGIMSSINYFENKCAASPFEKPAAVAEAVFGSFRGTRGLFQVAQAPGRAPMLLALVDGVRPNSLVDISIRHAPVKDCLKLRHQEVKLSQRLAQLFTDHAGLAVLPWTEAERAVLGTDFLGSTVLIIDTMTQHVIDCAVVRIKGDPEDYERTKSDASVHSVSLFTLLGVLIFLRSQIP